MGNDGEVLDAVLSFNQAINDRDLDALVALMTDDHAFVDSAGGRVDGRDACRSAWQGFFDQFPDYRNHFDALQAIGETVHVTGRSTCSVPELAGPARWEADVRAGLVVRWQVFDPAPPPSSAAEPPGPGALLPLVHLNLTVSDLDASVAFYRQWFGFTQPARTYPDGTVFLGNPDGFDLALHPGPVPESPGSAVHFGFRPDEPAIVRALHAALLGAGVPVIESFDTEGHVGFKCHDPDGYAVEVYWEPRPG